MTDISLHADTFTDNFVVKVNSNELCAGSNTDSAKKGFGRGSVEVCASSSGSWIYLGARGMHLEL